MKNKRICRLCLNIIRSDNYEVMKEIEKEMLEVLLINMNLSISKQPVMCGECAGQLQQCFSFKAICLCTEDHIAPLVSPYDGTKVELKEVFIKQFKSEDGKTFVEKICRFCMDPINENNFIPLNKMYKNIFISEILQKYIPEMDLTSIQDCVSCEFCFESLQKAFGFLSHCLENEKIVQRSYRNNKKSRKTVDLSEVWQSSVDVQKRKDSQGDLKSNDDDGNDEDVPDLGSSETINSNTKQGKKKRNIPSLPEVETVWQESSEQEHVSQGKSKAKKITMKVHRCLICSFQSSRKSVTITHVLSHKDISEVPTYKCDKCTFETKYRGSIAGHRMRHEDPDVRKIHKCTFCSFKTDSSSGLKAHQRKHMLPSEVSMYKCNECPFETKHKSSLNYHSVIHRRSKLFKCAQCGYKTKHKRSFDAHIICHKDPSEMTLYKCDECKFETKTKTGLNRHKERHRYTDRIFKCKVCAHKTTRAKYLKIHMKTHGLPQAEYKCSECTFTTRYKECITRHQLCHKDMSDVTVYKCGTCEYVAKYKTSLISHLLVHKDESEVTMYYCALCDFKTKTGNRLKVHQRIHKKLSEVKVYRCDKCDFKSRHKNSYTNHLVLHMDPSQLTMYKCSLCDYQSKHKRCIPSHMKYMHKDK